MLRHPPEGPDQKTRRALAIGAVSQTWFPTEPAEAAGVRVGYRPLASARCKGPVAALCRCRCRIQRKQKQQECGLAANSQSSARQPNGSRGAFPALLENLSGTLTQQA